MEPATGMAGFITALTSGITTDTLWAEVTKAAPFIVAMFIFAFGYKVLRKVIRGGSNGKAKI